MSSGAEKGGDHAQRKVTPVARRRRLRLEAGPCAETSASELGSLRTLDGWDDARPCAVGAAARASAAHPCADHVVVALARRDHDERARGHERDVEGPAARAAADR